MSKNLQMLLTEVINNSKSKKYKKTQAKKILLKRYFCLVPSIYRKDILVSISGSKKHPYFKFIIDWKDNDKCLFILNAEKFSNQILLGYIDKNLLCSITSIDIQDLEYFIMETDFRKKFIENKKYINLKDFNKFMKN